MYRTVWTDLDRELFAPFRRALQRASEPNNYGPRPSLRGRLIDDEADLVFVAELPGVAESDIDITVDSELLSVSASRTPAPPEGARLHRSERGPWRFRRSFTLPAAVDPERTRATLRDGVLRVRMAKAPEHQPRQIKVEAI